MDLFCFVLLFVLFFITFPSRDIFGKLGACTHEAVFPHEIILKTS